MGIIATSVNNRFQNSTNNLNTSNEDYKVILDISDDEIKTKEFEIDLIKDMEVFSPEEIKPDDQVLFDFDMPLKKQNIDSNKIIHELIEDINEIEVNNPIHIAGKFIDTLKEMVWDQGNEFFQPTSFQISNINVGFSNSGNFCNVYDSF